MLRRDFTDEVQTRSPEEQRFGSMEDAFARKSDDDSYTDFGLQKTKTSSSG